MAAKVQTKASQPSNTSIVPNTVQTKPQWWSTTPFDKQETTTEDSFGVSSPSTSASSPPPEVQLKNTQGNYSFSNIAISDFVPATVQTKMVVGAPDDKYEKEADAMADKVMTMNTSPIQTAVEDNNIQKQDNEDEDLNLKPLSEDIQRDYEDEGITLKPLSEGIQRQDYEDDGITLKPLSQDIQRQNYEDDGITLKPLAEEIQRDYEDEGITLKPLAEGIQRDYEDEGITLKPLAKGIQRQDYEDEGINLKPIAKDITAYKKPTVNKIDRDVNLSAKDGAFQASSNVESTLKSTKGAGKPLPDSSRNFMESRFGNDFGNVRIHTGSSAVQMNKSLQAKAFTHGNDIYFNSGHQNLQSTAGKTLLAHELTHTIQQTGASPLQAKKLDDRSAKNNQQKESSLRRKKLPTYILAENIQKEEEDGKIATKPLAQEISSVTSGKALQRDDDKKDKVKDKVEEAKKGLDDDLAEKQKDDPEVDLDEGKKRMSSMKKVGDKMKQKVDSKKNDDEIDDVDTEVEPDVEQVDKEQENQTKSFQEKVEAKVKNDKKKKGDDDENPDGVQQEITDENLKNTDTPVGENETDELENQLGLDETNGEQTSEGEPPVLNPPPPQKEKAPESPQDDPAFKSAIEANQAITEQQKSHETPEDASKEAQNASVDPGQEMRVAQSEQTKEASQKEPGIFDREAFVSALMSVLEKNAPKSQKDVENKKGTGDEASATIKQEVEKEKVKTGGDFQSTVQSPPNPKPENSKPVGNIPSVTEKAGETPTTEGIDPLAASPKQKSTEQIEKPSQEISSFLDELIPEKTDRPIQTKPMMVGAPNDKYEQEADKMAAKVMTMSDNSASLQTATETSDNKIQNSKISQEEDDLEIQEQPLAKDIQKVETQDTSTSFKDNTPLANNLSIQTSSERLIQRDKGELNSQELTEGVSQDNLDVPLGKDRVERFGPLAGQSNAVKTIEQTKQQIGEENTQNYREGETGEIDQTQQVQLANILTATQEKQDLRTEQIEGVNTSQTETKTADEQKRDEVNQAVNAIYNRTDANVNGILDRMDRRVDAKFNEINNRANKVFESTVEREFWKWHKSYYKDKHGIKIPIGFKIKVKKWGKVKFEVVWSPKMTNWPLYAINKVFTGLPDSVNQIYETAKQAYINTQKAGVHQIADIVEEEMMNAKSAVEQGKNEVAQYVNSLAPDLKEIGATAAADIMTKFENLEQVVQNRQNTLVDNLSKKYEESIQAIDDRIEELKAANKGLINKLLDVLAAIAKWILKFIAQMLKPVLSKIPFVGPVVNPLLDAIIDDPGGVIGSFISGMGDGIKNFLSNISKHIKNGLFEWLFGVGLPIVLPKKFDGEGILSILLQLFGLTTDYILDLAGDFFPLPIVELVGMLIEDGASVFKDIEGTLTELGVPPLGVKFFGVMKDIIVKGAEGFVGLLEFGKEGLATLQEGFMDIIMFKVAIPLVIQKGIEYMLKLTNPAGGVVAIVEGLVKLVIFFINNKDEIKELLDTLGQAIVAMVQKSRPLIASIMEMGLSQMIPILLSFLASLLGLDAIPKLIAKALEAMLAPVTKLFTFIFEKISALFKGIKEKLGFGDNGEDDAKKRAERAAEDVEDEGRDKREPDSVKSSLSKIADKHDFTDRKDKKDKPFTFEAPGKMPWNNERYYVKGETTKIEPEEDTEDSTNSTSSSSKKTTTARRKPLHNSANNTPEIQPQIQREIDYSQGNGTQLKPDLQMSMEQAFKHDFSGVTIHHDSRGDRLSRSLDAQAFTVNNDIYFRQGSYKPDTIQGKRLLAHELTHVVQQSERSSTPKIQRKIDWKDPDKDLKVEEKISGSKSKAKFEVKFLLINRGDILPKVKKDITKIVNENKTYTKVVGKLLPLKKKYNLKDIDTKKINKSQYTITAELPPPQSSSGQKKSVNSSNPDVDGANLAHVLQRSAGQGSQIKSSTRGNMESAFGYSFNDVKIHTNEDADVINRSINARAFTTGKDIYFRQGAYQPDTIQGKHLLAHELTHVVQQSGGQVQMQTIEADRGKVGGISGNKYTSIQPRADVVQRKALPNRSMNLIQRAGELSSGGRKVGEATAQYFLGPEDVDIKTTPRNPKGKSKMTLKVTLKKEKKKDLIPDLPEGGTKEGGVTADEISPQVLNDLQIALRVIANQDPKPEIVEAKLEDVRRHYDLRLLMLTGVGFTGDNIEFNIVAKGQSTDKEFGDVFKLLFDIQKKYSGKSTTPKGDAVQTKPLENTPTEDNSSNEVINRKPETNSQTIQKGPLSNLGRNLGTSLGKAITDSNKSKKESSKEEKNDNDTKKIKDQIEGDTSDVDDEVEQAIKDQPEGQTEGEDTTETATKVKKEKEKEGKSKKKRKARIVGFDVNVDVIRSANDPSTVNMKIKAKAKKK